MKLRITFRSKVIDIADRHIWLLTTCANVTYILVGMLIRHQLSDDGDEKTNAKGINHERSRNSESRGDSLRNFMQHGIRDSAAIYTGTHRVNMIGATEVPSDHHRENAKEQEQFHAKTNPATAAARIAIKAKDRIIFVDSIDVVVAKAQGNYVGLMHKCGCYLVRETMATAEQKLAPFGFLRIHRSILVNTTLVKDLWRDNTGTYVLRTIGWQRTPGGPCLQGQFEDDREVMAGR